MPLRLLCPCKINLILNILGRRPDGFHELETILFPVPFHDELTLEAASCNDAIVLTCDDPNLAVDRTNLVVRAAEAFFAATRLPPRVRLHLSKRVPMAAGLGGGSSNAAITLRGLNELFGNPLDQARLHELAGALGSDVPFFLQHQPALATGRGEHVQPLPPLRALGGTGLVLVRPGFGISTPWAYQQLAHFPDHLNGRPGRAAQLAADLTERPLQNAAAGLYNALEAPAFNKYPWLLVLQEFMRAEGAVAALMSGSGSTTFAIAESPAHAARIAARVRDEFGERNWIQTVAL